MKGKSKSECPSPLFGAAVRDISCELPGLNTLEQQGKGVTAPVSGVVAKDEESDWDPTARCRTHHGVGVRCARTLTSERVYTFHTGDRSLAITLVDDVWTVG